jgi:hypothetical protein
MTKTISIKDKTESKLQFVYHLEPFINFDSIYLYINNIRIMTIYKKSIF